MTVSLKTRNRICYTIIFVLVVILSLMKGFYTKFNFIINSSDAESIIDRAVINENPDTCNAIKIHPLVLPLMYFTLAPTNNVEERAYCLSLIGVKRNDCTVCSELTASYKYYENHFRMSCFSICQHRLNEL